MDIISVLQGRGLVSTITVEPYLGQGGAGPLYGPAVEVDAFVEAQRRGIRDSSGDQVVSSSRAFTRLDAVTAPPKSRVTHRGVPSFVIVEERHDAAGLPLPSHTELHLT